MSCEELGHWVRHGARAQAQGQRGRGRGSQLRPPLHRGACFLSVFNCQVFLALI